MREKTKILYNRRKRKNDNRLNKQLNIVEFAVRRQQLKRLVNSTQRADRWVTLKRTLPTLAVPSLVA